MLNWLIWIFVYFVFVYITGACLGFMNVWYQKYKFFNPYGIKYSWNIKYIVNKWKFFFMTRDHFVESDYRLRKKYPRERFVGRVDQSKPVIVLQDLALIRKLTVKNFNNFVDRKVCVKDYETLTPRCLYFLRDDFLEIDVRKVASFMVNDVIAKCVYGMRVNTIRDVKNEFYEMGNIIASDRNNYIPHDCSNIHPDTPNIDVAQEYFYRLTSNAMRKRESYILERNDMLQLFVKAKKGTLKHDGSSDDNKEFGFASVSESKSKREKGEKEGQRVWSNLDFAAQAISFHGDGYNTVVTALSFALHELALQPQIQERLAREIMLQHERNEGSVTLQSIKNMKYMDMVVSETLRLWPPITYLERLCVKDSSIGKPNPRAPREYMIKKGTSVWIPIWAIHRDPRLFPNPEKFDPERFSNQNIANINRMAYMPFGSGPRNCIGSKFALCELKIFLYYIILYTKVYPSKKTCIPSKLCPESLDVRLMGGHTLNIKARSRYRDLSL